ncbi:MAG: capsular biosynthesis protein [Bacteroidaceae bacterium]|nr:capsular biosynthesis protein [Bacteroidaceae bacterium]
MRIGLLLPTNIAYAPYLKIYTNVLDQMEHVEYDIIYADKKGLNEDAKYPFRVKTDDNVGKIQKLIYYYRFSRFILKALRKEKYDKLIVFGPQVALFMPHYLHKHYKNRFIMDYRDLSIEQSFMGTYRKILDDSSYNMISSPGFKEYLPKREDYIVSHNFDITTLEEAIKDVKDTPYHLAKTPEGKYNVMNVGGIGIRHVEQDKEIIQALANDDRFVVTFSGRGFGVPVLEEYVNEHQIKNVAFTGYYDKKDEPEIVKKATFIMIYNSLDANPRTAISNRFYNSIMFRKPMLTRLGTIQGDYAKDYGMGVAVPDTNQLSNELVRFFEEFDWEQYEKQRLILLNRFKDDYQVFKDALMAFASDKD